MELISIIIIATGIVVFLALALAALCRYHKSCQPVCESEPVCELCGASRPITCWGTHVCVACAYKIDKIIENHRLAEKQKATNKRKASYEIRQNRLFERAMRGFPWHQGGC